MATSIESHSVLVVEILEKFKDEDKPARAIAEYVANNISTMTGLEAGAYGEAEDIANSIYNKGTRVGYKNGVETTLQEVAELKDRLL